MTDPLREYRAGAHRRVRRFLDESMRHSEQSNPSDGALQVAEEFVDRSISNLTALHNSLEEIGYRFSNPEAALVIRQSSADAAVLEFESEFGSIPGLVRAWYCRIESVDFRQCPQQFSDRGSPLAGLGWNTPMVVQSLEAARSHWVEYTSECERMDAEMRELGREVPTDDLGPTLLTGGCASNNDLKGLELPNTGFDGVLYNDGGGDITFGDEIARGFACSGFPMLTAPKRTLKVIRTLYGEPDRDFLDGRMPVELKPV